MIAWKIGDWTTRGRVLQFAAEAVSGKEARTISQLTRDERFFIDTAMNIYAVLSANIGLPIIMTVRW